MSHLGEGKREITYAVTIADCLPDQVYRITKSLSSVLQEVRARKSKAPPAGRMDLRFNPQEFELTPYTQVTGDIRRPRDGQFCQRY